MALSKQERIALIGSAATVLVAVIGAFVSLATKAPASAPPVTQAPAPGPQTTSTPVDTGASAANRATIGPPPNEAQMADASALDVPEGIANTKPAETCKIVTPDGVQFTVEKGVTVGIASTSGALEARVKAILLNGNCAVVINMGGSPADVPIPDGVDPVGLLNAPRILATVDGTTGKTTLERLGQSTPFATFTVPIDDLPTAR